MLAGMFLLPVASSVLKELLERKRTSVLIRDAEDDVREVGKFVERVQHIRAMQFLESRIVRAVELVADVIASVRLKRRRLRQSGVVDCSPAARRSRSSADRSPTR